jgi:manganese transport system substrate-binding protein
MRFSDFRPLIALILAACLSMTACSAASQPAATSAAGNTAANTTTAAALPKHCASQPTAPIPEKAIRVLTTFTIPADMARNVICDRAQVDSITKVGAEIHGYEPTPSDVAKAQNATIVLVNGMNLERWFEKFMTNVRNVPSVTLTDGIVTIPIAEGSYQDKPNPHAWMSPKNALVYVENIRKAMSNLDPAGAAVYAANAKAYSDALVEVDKFLTENLAGVPEANRFMVTCEGAFSYLIRDYGLKELYMWPINSDQAGSPQQVAKVIDSVRANKIPAVFCESTVNNDPQKEVARQTGARFGGVLYVDSLSEATGPVPTYLELIRHDSKVLVKGLLGS